MNPKRTRGGKKDSLISRNSSRILNQSIDDFTRRLGVEILIRSRKNQKLKDSTVEYIWHCVLSGALANECGGLYNLIKSAPKSKLKV